MPSSSTLAEIHDADPVEHVPARSSPTRESTDRECDRLVARFHEGDGTAFADLYLHHHDRIYDYLRVALRDADEAFDATHEVFADALRALPRYEVRDDYPFRAWLFTIARNHAIRHFRRRKPVTSEDPAALERRREGPSEPRWVAPGLDWVSDPRLLLLIEQLPTQQRLTITLFYLLDLETAEIAELTDCTPESVRQLRHRALRFLERRLVADGITARRVMREPSLMLRRPNNLVRARRFALARSAQALPRARW